MKCAIEISKPMKHVINVVSLHLVKHINVSKFADSKDS